MDTIVAFTEARVRALRASAEPGQRVEYQDRELRALRLRVSPSAASWYVFKRIPGGPMRRILLGSVDDMSVERARKEAIKVVGRLLEGRDPSAEKRARKVEAERERLTLRAALEIYLDHKSRLRPATRKTYERDLRLTFGDYLDRPLTELTPDKVRERHRARMTKGVRANGRSQIGASPARADGAVRALRAIVRFVRVTQKLDMADPASEISATRQWANVPRRKRALLDARLVDFVRALDAVPEDLPPYLPGTQRDLVRLILATGLRIGAAAGLRWDEVDLEAAKLTIPAARMKGKRDHSLPLGPLTVAMLRRRLVDPRKSAYVFPGASVDKPIDRISPHFVARLKDGAGEPFVWSPHDLRRTVLTMLEAMDVSAYALKRIAAHSQAGDVTAGYLVDDVERLRAPIERLERAVLGASGKVVKLHRRAG